MYWPPCPPIRPNLCGHIRLGCNCSPIDCDEIQRAKEEKERKEKEEREKQEKEEKEKREKEEKEKKEKEEKERKEKEEKERKEKEKKERKCKEKVLIKKPRCSFIPAGLCAGEDKGRVVKMKRETTEKSKVDKAGIITTTLEESTTYRVEEWSTSRQKWVQVPRKHTSKTETKFDLCGWELERTTREEWE